MTTPTLRELIRARITEFRAARGPIRGLPDLAAAVGREQSTLNTYLLGRRRLGPDLAAQLAAALDLDLSVVEAAAEETRKKETSAE